MNESHMYNVNKKVDTKEKLYDFILQSSKISKSNLQ